MDGKPRPTRRCHERIWIPGRLAALSLIGACLAGCALTELLPDTSGPAQHFPGGIAGLAARDGWVDLPVRNWLLPDGLVANAVVICPAAACEGEAMAALFDLTGREAGVAAQLTRDPARLLHQVLSRQGRKPASPRSGHGTTLRPERTSPADIQPLARGAWHGAQVSIGSAATSRQAHLVMLARAEPARLLLVIAADPARARQAADLAAWPR